MAYAFPGEGSLDYYPCHYGASKLVFRGPKKSLSHSYIAALGGTETYGKFVSMPFASVVEDVTGFSVVNLGCMNAGPDVYLNDPEVLDIASGADLTIVQIVGAQNLCNALYSVHPRRNDRFLQASAQLKNLYREVDFTEFHFTRHLLHGLYQASPHRFVEVAAELQETWVNRMRQLLRSIHGPKLLLWMADNVPPPAKAGSNPYGTPALVTAEMVASLQSYATAYLEVVASQEAADEGLEGMAFSAMERTAAEGVPGPKAHAEVAKALSVAIPQLLGRA